jgi:RNA polymerase sigma-70 factor, ECF subfamily
MPNKVDEQQIQSLVQQAKEGNSEAFGKVYDLLSRHIYNFLFARVRQKELAEDLLQTTFYKAWNNLGSYRPKSEAKFSTWIFQIANYTLIDYWRTKKETVELDKVDNLALFAQDPKLYEEYDYLWSALKDLPEDYQTILDLRFKQDLTVAEAAHVMSKTEVGIRVLQHRAIKALTNLLQKRNKL